MADKHYYVHFSGENLGPISSKLMQKLIQIGRLHGDDFAAASGSKEWKRLSEMTEFQSLLPAAPHAQVPADTNAAKAGPTSVTETKTATTAAAKATKAAPPPKAAEVPPAVKQVPQTESAPLQGFVTVGKKMFKIVEVRQAGLLLEASGNLEEGTEIQMQISGNSFPKPFEMKAVLVGKEQHQGVNVYMTEFVRPNPAHKRTLAPYVAKDDKNESP